MRKRKSSGRHRAQSPARAYTTILTARLIISFFIAAVLIGLLLLICYSGKLSGGKVSHPHVAAPSPASPLGGANLPGWLNDVPLPLVKGFVNLGTTPTQFQGGGTLNGFSHPSPHVTTLPHDEPLLVDSQAPADTLNGGGDNAETQGNAAPQQRSIWTTNATAYVRKIVAQQEAARVRADLVARINNFLAGSSLAGLGECMVANQERTTVSAKLCAAVAYAESSLGRQNLYPYNAWGMYGVHPSSWEDGVMRWFDNCLKHECWKPWQTGYDLQNYPSPYCVLPPPNDNIANPVYGPNVTGLEERI